MVPSEAIALQGTEKLTSLGTQIATAAGPLIVLRTKLAVAAVLMAGSFAQAQDVPGIELCTHENNMARRTGCLQSNIDYLQRLIARNAATTQRRLDAANAEIAALRAALVDLRARVIELQAGTSKPDAAFGKPGGK